MTEVSPENTPAPEVESKRPLIYQGRHEDINPFYKRNRRMIIIGSLVTSLGLGGAAIAGISSAEETGYISLNPPVSTETTIEDDYTYDPGTESTETPIDSGFVTTESWGESCTSSITVNYNGTAIDVETDPNNSANEWTAIRYSGLGTVSIEQDNSFEADWLFDKGTTIELFAMARDQTVIEDPENAEFDPDNRNHEECGSFTIDGYTDLGAPIIKNTAPALPEETPSESPTPTTETPTTGETNNQPLVFEAQELDGNKYNCAIDGYDVEVFFEGTAPSGYKLAVSAIEHRDMAEQIEVIAFVNNNGKAELPETDGHYLEIKAILVPDDTMAGFQEFVLPPDRLQFQYEEALKNGQFDFDKMYPWLEEDVTYYDDPAGRCH